MLHTHIYIYIIMSISLYFKHDLFDSLFVCLLYFVLEA